MGGGAGGAIMQDKALKENQPAALQGHVVSLFALLSKCSM